VFNRAACATPALCSAALAASPRAHSFEVTPLRPSISADAYRSSPGPFAKPYGLSGNGYSRDPRICSGGGCKKFCGTWIFRFSVPRAKGKKRVVTERYRCGLSPAGCARAVFCAWVAELCPSEQIARRGAFIGWCRWRVNRRGVTDALIFSRYNRARLVSSGASEYVTLALETGWRPDQLGEPTTYHIRNGFIRRASDERRSFSFSIV